ncbi:MAG: UDP-N-acetylglucosamine 2-epimerase (non-hydrolyzing) [Candidatus Eremiobacteraeota bacterium]|nr:UDP-N-acetylglucosamine 2-epimerase (non-hydrolyzing) [Candidatus Eremiobacteraeota bacterium]
MKIVSIVGARPEFVQVAVLSRVLRMRHDETLVHTGQHYDDRMSEQFFTDLGIPKPEINLGVGSAGPSAQLAEMLRGLAEAFSRLDPDLVVVRGDTNSTLAGAIVAKQLLFPLVHIEAGMRSYDRTMPEEINRIVTDHIADVQLVTDDDARTRLAGEGIVRGVYVCGDVMFDIFSDARRTAAESLEPELRALANEPFDLLTLHRAENTDDRERLAAILAGFAKAPRRVIFPVHPRTAARLLEFAIDLPPALAAIEPLGYRQMVALECAATTIFTDSGGVQREAYFAEVPCVTLRDSTEWTNTVDAGWNRLVGASTPAIAATLAATPARPATHPPLFGNGRAAHEIVAALESPEVAEIVRVARATRAARGYAASGVAANDARASSGAVTR